MVGTLSLKHSKKNHKYGQHYFVLSILEAILVTILQQDCALFAIYLMYITNDLSKLHEQNNHYQFKNCLFYSNYMKHIIVFM